MIYNNIKHDIIHCTACPLAKELDYGCTPQWGMGSKFAHTLVLNFKSSQDSHLIEKPIETKYLLLLKRIIKEAGLEDKDIFVTNLLKCKSNTSPMKPFRENIATCKKQWLYKELESVPLKNIITMGQSTLTHLLDNKMTIDDVNNIETKINGLRIYSTHSFEEIFRKGQAYIDHAIQTFKIVKDTNAKI